MCSELEAIRTTQKSKLSTEINDVCEEVNLNVEEFQQFFQKQLKAISSHFRIEIKTTSDAQKKRFFNHVELSTNQRMELEETTKNSIYKDLKEVKPKGRKEVSRLQRGTSKTK